MLIDFLYKKLINLPTIINIDDEIFFINELQKANINDIKLNMNKFISILELLQTSHQDNGIFEVTSENVDIFFNFVFWIKEIQAKTGFNIDKYADGFDTNFDGSLKM
ncbi:hypothetical protein ACPWUF_10885 [Bisgaard Taxon 46]